MRKAGAALLIVGAILGFVVGHLPQPVGAGSILFGLLTVVLLLSGGFLFWRGRQHAARMMVLNGANLSQPFVLYLRDFRSDPSTLKQVLSGLLTSALMAGLTTEEEQLAEVMQPLGQLLAIGRPGEELPTPGAMRMYASDDEWHDLVSARMRDARLVVIRAGSGEGLLWEFKRAAELVDRERLLFLMIRMKREPYRFFRQTVNALFDVRLPDAEACSRFGRISGFIRFQAGGEAEFLRLRAPWFRRSVYKPLQRLFTFTLKPVFERFGVAWQRPPVNGLMVSAFSVLGLFVLLFITLITVAVVKPPQAYVPPAPEEATAPVTITDPYTIASERMITRFAESPELRQAFAGRDPAEAQTMGFELAAKGLRRLDDGQLVRRAQILAHIVEEADLITCAQVFRGEPKPYIDRTLRRLSSPDIDAWFDLSFAAAVAELQQRTAPPLPVREEITQSLKDLLATLPPADAAFLSSMIHEPRRGTVEDACRASRLLYTAAPQLPEPARTTLLRAMVSP
jgi:hypothetical protein